MPGRVGRLPRPASQFSSDGTAASSVQVMRAALGGSLCDRQHGDGATGGLAGPRGPFHGSLQLPPREAEMTIPKPSVRLPPSKGLTQSRRATPGQVDVLRQIVYVLVTAATLLILPDVARAHDDAGGRDARLKPLKGMQQCAAFDIHVVTLIEDAGEAYSASDDELAEATILLATARDACRRHAFADAYAAYGAVRLHAVHALAEDQRALTPTEHGRPTTTAVR